MRNIIQNDVQAQYLYLWGDYYPVEVWDSNLQRWVFFNQDAHAPCHMIAPTSEEPIILNRYANLGHGSDVKGLCGSKDIVTFLANGLSIRSIDSKKLREMVSIAKSNSKFNVSTYASNFDEFKSFLVDGGFRISNVHYTDLPYSSNYIKCKSDDFIKVESGFKYVILEALDLNSRAFILPMYKDTRRTNVYNQLIDLEQILIRSPLPKLVQNYSRAATDYGTSNVQYNTNLLNTDIFEADKNYVYTEIVNNSRYLCVADLYDAEAFSIVRINSNSTDSIRNCSPIIGANAISYAYGLYNRATAVRECYGFAPNYKYLNVKGLDEQ